MASFETPDGNSGGGMDVTTPPDEARTGESGDVPVSEAALDVQDALEKAHPGARWMMLAWQGNPRQELLSGVDRDKLLVIDIDHDRVPRDDRMKDFQGAPFLPIHFTPSRS